MEPTETKSTALTSASSWNRSEGTSIMAPSISRSGSGCPWRRIWATSRSIIARAFFTSSRSVTMGSMTRNSRPDAARNSARSCVLRSPGRSSPMRIARQPMAGFSSLLAVM